MYERAAKLQSILVSYCPSPEMRDRCDSIYQQMTSDNLSETEVEKQIIGAFSDGLFHGNWPWVIGS
jgi:hypothetical protein